VDVRIGDDSTMARIFQVIMLENMISGSA